MMLLLLGPPGVGKGTQADLLTQKYKMVRFSMGDILRDEVTMNTSIGNRVKRYLNQGTLAPDELVFEIVDDFLIENRDTNVLFDGFPRNINQAMSLEKALARLGLSINLALELALSRAEIVRRMTNRRYCTNCGRIYNILTNPPQKDNFCDQCRLPLSSRDDDKEEIINKRFETYEDQTRPLVDYYKTLSVYRQIEASGTPQEVFEKASSMINALTG